MPLTDYRVLQEKENCISVVRVLFGVLEPSWNHATRIWRILKSIYWTQIRLYQDRLWVKVQEGCGLRIDVRRYAEYRRLEYQSTEFMWQGAWLNLPKKQNNAATAANNVIVVGDANLPGVVAAILKKGPMISYEPSSRRHERLAVVRRVADRAGYKKRERSISDSVDTLRRTESQAPKKKPPFENVVSALNESGLAAVGGDKECGMVVLSEGLFQAKASAAIAKRFVAIKKKEFLKKN